MAWHRVPAINAVLEVIEKIVEESKGKIDHIDEETLLHRLERENVSVSRADLSKLLMLLETLGKVQVQLSTKEEKIIRLVKNK